MNRFRPRFGGRQLARLGATGSTGGTQAPTTAGVQGPIPGVPEIDEADIFDPMGNGMDVMFYTTLVQNLSSASPNGLSNIQIDAGIDFYWVATTYQADVSVGAEEESTIVIPLVTLLINDTGSRKNLMNQATPLGAIAGSGERPYRLLKPRLFHASSTISFTWTSYVAGGTTYENIYLALHGFTKPAGS